MFTFSPDGSSILFFDETSLTLWRVPSDGGAAITVAGSVSFYGTSLGDNEQVVFTRVNSLWRVSAEGGILPHWNPVGRELLYVSDGALLSVSVQTMPKLVVGAPRQLFSGSEMGLELERGFDIALDGQRIIAVRGSDSASRGRVRDRLVIVANWGPAAGLHQ